MPGTIEPRRRFELVAAILGLAALVPSVVLIGTVVAGSLACIILGYVVMENR